MRINIARPHNFDVLTDGEWIDICHLAKKKYPRLTLKKLDKLIENGIVGSYNDIQFSINSFTIFKWIELYLEEDNIDLDEYKRKQRNN